MYDITFPSPNSASGWSARVELFNDVTGEPLFTTFDDVSFALAVENDCGRRMLSGSTDDGRITRPSAHIPQWTFTASEMGAFEPGCKYKMGLSVTTSGGTTALAVGSFTFTDGVVS